MSVFQEIFNAATLELSLPHASYEPEDSRHNEAERKQVFYDEQLRFVLSIRIKLPNTDADGDPERPPTDLLGFLAHLQITLEAAYVPPLPSTPRTALLTAPPRSAPSGELKVNLAPLHPSISVPNTPNPTPAATGDDIRYIRSEGTHLLTCIWGQNAEIGTESFSLSWLPSQKVWVAMYASAITVSFLRLSFNDPLLCLTAFTTLRENPISMNQPKHPLAEFLMSKGGTRFDISPSPTMDAGGQEPVEINELTGLEEVNLLSGLSAGPTFVSGDAEYVSLSSSRLGNRTRRQMFSLPPFSTSADTSGSSKPVRVHPVLRKSFRKVLQTVSGFRVRMRQVFVPYVMPSKDYEKSTEEDELARRESGNEERTVVLCVEVENTGEAGPGVGFMVEGAEVTIGGEGASTSLISQPQSGDGVFPLLLGPMEQYNLLYVVSFFQSPNDSDRMSLTHNVSAPAAELYRAVVIDIHGKPFLCQTDAVTSCEPSKLNFPTQTFSTRWNCTLDLSSSRAQEAAIAEEIGMEGAQDTLPEPASPFPMPNTPRADTSSEPSTPVAGHKRHTLPGPLGSPLGNRMLKPISPLRRASTPVGGGGQQFRRNAPSKLSLLPPSVVVDSGPPTATTYAAPPAIEIHDMVDSPTASAPQGDQWSMPPPTPAYPAYPMTPPENASQPVSQALPTHSHSPLNEEPSIEIPRAKGLRLGMGTMTPPTPGPTLKGFTFSERGVIQSVLQGMRTEESGEPIVVSVSLTKAGRPDGSDEIYPLDRFSLHVFVFNKSSWTRRLEISCPNKRRRWRWADRRANPAGVGATTTTGGKNGESLGMLPLDNRVRIGPLRPSTCQIVKMDFLALTPGVHSIDILTLTDVESGVSTNLRAVMDLVVHEVDE